MENSLYRDRLSKNVGMMQSQLNSNAFSNLTNTVRHSMISTSLSKSNTRDSASRSKIQNLPNYKKQDMGTNLTFVVVFQTIEIERLSEEIETLRVKLREYQRELFNAQNYEIQIKELTQKCIEYENERAQYREELQKMNKICETLYHDNQTYKIKEKQNGLFAKQLEEEKKKNDDLEQEIQRWKTRVKKLQGVKEKELGEIREMMENQRKSTLNREIKEIQTRHKNEISSLQNELRRLKDLLDLKNQESSDLLQQIQKLQEELKEVRQQEDKIVEYEEKIHALGQELLKLSQLNELKSNQLDEARKKEFLLNQQLNTEKVFKFDNDQLRELFESKKVELSEMKIKILELENQLSKYRESEHYITEIENKYSVVSRENQRLSKSIKQKINEEEKLRNKINLHERALLKYENIEEEMNNYDNKVSVMKAENDRLINILNARSLEIQNLKNKCINFESGMNSIDSVQKDKKIWEEKYRNLINTNDDLHKYIQRLQNELNDLRTIDKISKQTQRSKEKLQRQNDRLNSTLRTYTEEIQSYRSMTHKLKQFQHKLQKYDQQNKSYQNKTILLSQQVQRLNNLVQSKNEEIERLEKDKIDLHSLISKYKGYQTELDDTQYLNQKLKDQLHVCKSELERQEKKGEQIERKNKQSAIQWRNKEEKLNLEIKNKKNQYDECVRRYNALKNDLLEFNQLQRLCQKQQNRITVYLRDLDVLKEKNSDYQQLLDHEKKRSQNLHYEVKLMKEELEKRQSNQFAHEKQQLQLKQQKQVNHLLLSIAKLQNEVNQLTTKYQDLLSQVRKIETQKDIQFVQEQERSIQI